MGDKTASSRTLGSIGNAVLMLDLLGMGPAFQQLTELAKRSGLSPATVHRTLQSLLDAGIVEQSPDSLRYSLGPELVYLSERYLARLPVVQAMAPYLVDLRNTTKATIKVGLLVRGWIVYVDHIQGEDVKIGAYRALCRLCPALGTAAGRILLSRASPDAWDEAVDAALVQDPLALGTNPRDCTQEDRASWAGSPYLVLEEPQSPGFLEVAAPVTDQRGRVLASLSASERREVLTEQALTDQVVPQLLRAAHAVGQTVTPP